MTRCDDGPTWANFASQLVAANARPRKQAHAEPVVAVFLLTSAKQRLQHVAHATGLKSLLLMGATQCLTRYLTHQIAKK